MHIYIYIERERERVQYYITNAPTYFGASAPFSGSFDIVFANVIKYLIPYLLHAAESFLRS